MQNTGGNKKSAPIQICIKGCWVNLIMLCRLLRTTNGNLQGIAVRWRARYRLGSNHNRPTGVQWRRAERPEHVPTRASRRADRALSRLLDCNQRLVRHRIPRTGKLVSLPVCVFVLLL